ncbi:hypothetical protein D3C72_1823990 [compost metagenome]
MKGNAVPIATNDVPMTSGRTMPTRSTQRPARTENSIGSTANTATSMPTLKVDSPICRAVSDTVIRPPVSATWFIIASRHSSTAPENSGEPEGEEGDLLEVDTALTAFILFVSSPYVEARFFCSAA